MHQNPVPGILAGAGGAGQGEQEGAVGHAAGGARLHGGGFNIFVTQHAEQLTESRYGFFVERFKRFGRHVAAGHTGAAGGDDHVHFRIGDPFFEHELNRLDFVFHDLFGDYVMARLFSPIHQDVAGLVVRFRAGVRNRHDGDVHAFTCRGSHK